MAAAPTKYRRADFEKFITEGGSVIIDGQHYFRAHELPSDGDLAGDDPNMLDMAQEEAEINAHRALAELNKIRQKREAAANPVASGMPTNPERRAHPLVGGAIPKEGPHMGAPLDLRPGAHHGDGHDPNAQPMTTDIPTDPIRRPPTPITSAAARPGGMNLAGGVPPPDPRLNSPSAHTFRRPTIKGDEGQKINLGNNTISAEDEDSAVGEPSVSATPTVDSILNSLTEEQRAKALEEAKQATKPKPAAPAASVAAPPKPTAPAAAPTQAQPPAAPGAADLAR